MDRACVVSQERYPVERKAELLAYGDSARIEELRREIAEIQARNAVSKYSLSAQQEFNKRNSRLREIRSELQGMIKKGRFG